MQLHRDELVRARCRTWTLSNRSARIPWSSCAQHQAKLEQESKSAEVSAAPELALALGCDVEAALEAPGVDAL